MPQDTKKILKKARKEFVLKFISSALLRVALLVIPICYSYAIDGATIGNFKNAYTMAIILILVTVTYRVSEWWNERCYEKLYTKLYHGFVDLGLEKTNSNSIHSLSRIRLGEYTIIMTDDIHTMVDFFASIVIRIVELCELLFIISYFFVINPMIGIITVVVCIISVVLLIIGGKKVEEGNEKYKQQHDKRIGILQELFLGMKEIKGFHIFKDVSVRIKNSLADYLHWFTKFSFRKVFLKHGILLFIDAFKLFFLIYGIYLLSQGHMAVGTILLIYNYYSKLSDLFVDVTVFNDGLRNEKVAERRFYRLSKYASEFASKEDVERLVEGNIAFQNILYGNRLDPILNDATLDIKAGEITVITGKSATGKTGFFDLLLKLNKQHTGMITIDGVDINDYGEELYSRLVSAVRKNPNFLNISIRDNLQMIEPDFEKIVEMCKQIGIHDDILNLTEGYDTILLTDGSNIRSDLKYLISIVRVLLKNSRILLFDESTNDLDKQTDLKLLNYFESIKSNHTIVIITREKHIIEASDKVALISSGKVIEEGTHQNLLKKSSTYRHFFKEL